ncbi:MAG: hypothetical protein IIY21_03090 [Clostridiales bacterium]|nr:hypothetical protein [Clostridiales bacterium]MBQ1570309.1 hypothetical protein [Clostridiales bacterium]
MTVTLYNNSSAYNVLYKSMGEAVASVTATVKGSCSIDTPTLLLNYNSASSFNYFYVSDWGRYYRVTNRMLVPGEHMMISGQSDPIASFASGIAGLDVYATRCEDLTYRSPELADPAVPLESDMQIDKVTGDRVIGTGSGYIVLGVV